MEVRRLRKDQYGLYRGIITAIRSWVRLAHLFPLSGTRARLPYTRDCFRLSRPLCQRWLSDLPPLRRLKRPWVPPRRKRPFLVPWHAFHLVAGLGAGVVESVVVMNPMEVVKIRLQAQKNGELRYRSATHAATTILREEGVGVFYRGVTLTAARQGRPRVMWCLIDNSNQPGCKFYSLSGI